MTVPYKWICSECASPNEARTDTCNECGCPAIVSVEDVEKRRLEPLPPELPKRPMTTALKIVVGICAPVALIGVVLERPLAPTTTLWWVAIGLVACGTLPLWIVAQKLANKPENEGSS